MLCVTGVTTPTPPVIFAGIFIGVPIVLMIAGCIYYLVKTLERWHNP